MCKKHKLYVQCNKQSVGIVQQAQTVCKAQQKTV